MEIKSYDWLQIFLSLLVGIVVGGLAAIIGYLSGLSLPWIIFIGLIVTALATYFVGSKLTDAFTPNDGGPSETN